MTAILDNISNRLNRFSLRVKLTCGLLALISMILFLVGIGLLAVAQHRKIEARINDESRLADLSIASRSAIFQAQHDEKDFLAHSKEIGVPEARARYATLLNLRITEILKNMAAIRSLSQDPEIVRQTRQIEESVNLYQNAFLEIIRLYEELGQGDSELEGKLRRQASEMGAIAERYHNQPLTQALLNLSRKEKDYLLSGQDKPAEGLRQEVVQTRENIFSLGLPKEEAVKVAALLSEYLDLFEQYFILKGWIDQGIETYRSVAHTVEPLLENLQVRAEQLKATTKQAQDQAARKALWTAIVAGSGAIFFGLLVTWLVYRNISHGVSECLGFAARLGEGDLQARIVPVGSDEFATLASALNRMADSLQQARQTLEKQQVMLGKSNALLRAEIFERQWSEANLRKTTDTLQALINASPLAIYTLDPQGQVQMWNRAAERIFGWSEAEAVGRFLPIIPPDKLPECQCVLQRALGGEMISGLELTRSKKDGSPVEVSLYTAPLYDDKGQITGVMALYADISGRKRMEENLRQEQQFSETIAESLPGVFYLFDKQGRFLQWNNNMEKITGYSAQEVATMGPLEFFDAEDRPRIAAGIEEAFLHGEATVEATLVTKNGRRIPHFYTGRRITLNGEDCILGMGVDISQRRQAEEEVKKQLAFQRVLMDTIPLPIFYRDREGHFLGCNTAFEKFLAKPREEIVGKTVYDFVPPKQADLYREKDLELLAHPGTQVYENVSLDATGALHDEIVHKATFPGPDGSVGGIVGALLDITERKRGEELSRLNERRMEAMLKLNQMADAPLQEIAAFALEEATRLTGSTIGYLAFMNEDETLLTMHAWSKTAMQECQIMDKPLSYPVESTGLWGEAVRQRRTIITNDYAAPNPWKKGLPEGHVQLQRHMNTPILDGNKIVIVAGVGNKASDYEESDVRQLTLLMEGLWHIIQRNRVEAALRESERNYRLVVNNVPAVVFKGYADWSVDCFDGKMEALTGYPKAEFDSRQVKWCNVVHPDDLDYVSRVFRVALQSGHSYVREHRIVTKSGEIKWVQCRGQIVCDAAGKVEHISGMTFDITDRKNLEDERLRWSKLESLGLLAGGIAHDFNNILTGILGNISLAVMDGYQEEGWRERLLRAEKGCQQAQILARQLLTFAKGGVPVKEQVSASTTIAECADFACRGSQVRCESDFPSDLWPLEVDPGQIGQVFQNLIINAIQAMPSGGIIKIRASNLRLGPLNDVALQEGAYVKITIQDQGIGIPAEYLPKIFDPYFTTKQKGSGLGLATAYSIVKNHQGQILVESKLGTGTTFQVYLPASDQGMVKEVVEEKKLLVGKGKILVMDDEEMIREVLGKMLANLGYEAEFAADGAEAIEIFGKAQENGNRFAAVILDLTVPGGMGGKESLEQLRRIDPKIKAIVSSGYSEDPIMADFRNYGFSGVIAKPYRVVDLSKTLYEVIQETAGN